MTITLKNKSNQTLILDELHGYAITDVQGLNPAPSNVNITKTAGGDGSLFNSAMIPSRNIVLSVYMLPHIQTHRTALYSFVSPGNEITLLISNGQRTVQISGVVESFDGTFYSQAEMFNISIICPQPFFENATVRTASVVAGTNTITNNGDYSCGFNAELKVVTSSTDISISDGTNTLTIDGTNLLANDIINICTKAGTIEVKKGITNLLNSITIQNGFPKLAAGTNTITLVNCTGGTNEMWYTELYGGL